MTELEQLYRAYFSDVYLYLKRLTGDEHLAEDLTAETFLRAMRALPDYRERSMPALGPQPLPAAGGTGTSVYYCPNDGSEDVLLWGTGLADGGALVAMPRLALGYYLLAALLLGRALWEDRRAQAGALLQREESFPER